jgi:hypothetical protein
MDRDSQRQNLRSTESSSCKDESYTLDASALPAGRPALACSTAAAPLADAFVTPLPCPRPPLETALSPPPFVVGNDVQIAYCPTAAGYGLTGTVAFTIALNDQLHSVFCQTLTGISDNQLNYLYGVIPSASGTIITAALSGNTATVKQLTKLNDTQVEEFIPLVQDAKFIVNTLAVEKARNSLVCMAYNDYQAAICPTGSYTGASASIPFVYQAFADTGTFIVPFSLKSSTGNQVAFTAINIPGLTGAKTTADSLAFAEAYKSLSCIYANDSITSTCCTGPSGAVLNLGYTNSVPVDTLPVLPSLSPRIGTFTVANETVFSTVSKSDANSLASSLALNALNCYFVNEDIAVACPTAGVASTYPLNNSVNTYWSATADMVTVPTGLTVDDVRLNTRILWPTAAPAGLTAGTLYYVNSATSSGASVSFKVNSATASHTDYQNSTLPFIDLLTSGTGATASILLDNTPGKYTYLLRGEVVRNDLTSSDTATTSEGVAILNSLLECYWVNSATAAYCPTAGFTGIDGNAYIIPASITASPGYSAFVDAGIIISYTSQADADAIAAEQARASLQCYYCNVRVDPTCTPPGATAWTDDQLPLSPDLFVPNCWSANATSGMPPGVVCSFLASTSQNTALSISNIPLKDKVEHTETCCYDSMPVYNTIFCTAGAERGASGLNSQDNFFLPSGTVVICATGPSGFSSHTGATAYTCGTSGSYFNQKQIDANNIAQDLVNSFVMCYYYNDAQTYAICPTGTIVAATGSVAAQTIVSMVSKSDANRIALSIAQSSVVCLDPTDFGITCAEITSTSNETSVAILGMTLKNQVAQSDCNTMTMTTTISGSASYAATQSGGATMVKLKICKADGTSADIIVPDFSGSGVPALADGGAAFFVTYAGPTGTTDGEAIAVVTT